MTDGDALLRAIIESPEEDTPRLAYADYLDEQGASDPTVARSDNYAPAARAELIRLQCKLEQLLRLRADRYQLEFRAREALQFTGRVFRFGGNLDMELEARAANLIAHHGNVWAENLPNDIQYGGFRRGFIEEAGMTGDVFLDRAEYLATRFPLRHIAFLQTSRPILRTLLACPSLARLRSASFAVVGRQAAELIADCAHLSGLEALDLRYCQIGDAGLAALSLSPHLARLSALRLWWNNLGEASCRTLLTAPAFARLTYLRVEREQFSPVSQRLLQERFGDQVFDEGAP